VLRDPTGRIAKGRNPHLTESMDIMALLLDLCGVPQPAGSRALSPLREHYQARADVFAEGGLICPQPANPIPGLHLKAPSGPTHHGPGVMLRTNDWKLVEYAEDCGELYDLQADPHEACNLYDSPSHADIRSRLQQRLIQRQLCKGQAPEDMRHG
jgi:arylsulfatase A-like enzyme